MLKKCDRNLYLKTKLTYKKCKKCGSEHTNPFTKKHLRKNTAQLHWSIRFHPCLHPAIKTSLQIIPKHIPTRHHHSPARHHQGAHHVSVCFTVQFSHARLHRRSEHCHRAQSSSASYVVGHAADQDGSNTLTGETGETRNTLTGEKHQTWPAAP